MASTGEKIKEQLMNLDLEKNNDFIFRKQRLYK